jgi:hypothetical protein
MKNMSSMEVVHHPKLAGKTQLIQVRKVAWSPVFFHVYCFEPDFSPSSPLCYTWRILPIYKPSFPLEFPQDSHQLRLKFNTLSCFMLESHEPCQLIPSFFLQPLNLSLKSPSRSHTLPSFSGILEVMKFY